jgi:Ni,Fe-hydrogenase I small subunit
MKSPDDNTLNGLGSFMDSLKKKGVSRRDFMKFCTAMAAAMALPSQDS